MSELNKDYLPYNRGTEILHGGTNTRQYKIKGNPNFRAKELDIEGLSLEEIEKEYRLSIDYKNLEKYLGEFLPQHHLVYSGENTENPQVHVFMEEIRPEEPLTIQDKIEFCRQLDSFYEKSWEMWKAIGRMTDLNLYNFVWGTSKKTHIRKLYFVDLFPATEEIDLKKSSCVQALKGIYEMVEQDVQDLYERYGYPFPKAVTVLFEMEKLLAD